MELNPSDLSDEVHQEDPENRIKRLESLLDEKDKEIQHLKTEIQRLTSWGSSGSSLDKRIQSWFLKAGVHMNSSKERSIVPDIPEHDSSLQDLIGNDYYINKVESNDRAIKNLSEDFFTDDSSKIPDEDEDEDNILTEKDMYFIITQDLMSLLEEMKYS